MLHFINYRLELQAMIKQYQVKIITHHAQIISQ